MSDNAGVVAGHCGECGYIFPDPNAASVEPAGAPCPQCGATTNRTFDVHASGSITFHEYARAKGRRQGGKRPYIETEGGEQPRVSKGDFVEKYRRIDHEANEYEEVIKDLETGEIIYETCEPLSEHWGHGSAKFSTPKKGAPQGRPPAARSVAAD